MPSSLFIFGARALPAPFLIEGLTARGVHPSLISRRAMPACEGTESLTLDINNAQGWLAPEGARIISLLPLWVFADHLDLFAKASHIIAIGSTSLFGKASSEDPLERAIAEKLGAAEAKIKAWSKQTGVPVTILRPTLIYDGQHDQNITRIRATIRRFGFFPVAWPAKGLRQPIHAGDVAKAILAALDNDAAKGQFLNIAGGEILPYREMVRRVFRAMGRPAIIIPLPVWLLKLTFSLAQKIGLIHEKHFGFGVFARMNEDLVFESKKAAQILCYNPRGFELKHFQTKDKENGKEQI